MILSLTPQTVGQGSAVVVLSPPMVEDTGLYMCRAVNEIGEDLSNLIVSVMGQWYHVAMLTVSVVSVVSVVSCSHVNCVSSVSGVIQSCLVHQWCSVYSSV